MLFMSVFFNNAKQRIHGAVHVRRKQIVISNPSIFTLFSNVSFDGFQDLYIIFLRKRFY